MEVDRSRRATGFMAVAFLLGGILLSRLAFLQLYEGERFLKQAEGNRLRIIPQTAPRGQIRDRHGHLLASNRLSYALALYPHKMTREQIDGVLDELKGLVGLDRTEAMRRLTKAGFNSARPVKLKTDLDATAIAKIAENQAALPGVSIEPDTIRFYPHGDLAAHVLGYTGEVTDVELTRYPERGYRLGDVLGKTGLERLHDKELRGENGARQVEVDARGRPSQVLKFVPAKKGSDLKLFLDLELQKAAEKALDEKHLTGVIVAMNPQNGEVLALASRPDFDPNIFSRKVKPEEWRRLQAANFPFVNRALSAYPPGSIFKIPMSLAALESGRCTPNRRFNSTGSMRVGNRIFHDWTSRGFGNVGIVQALQWSIDTVYYELGVEMGGKVMARYAHEFGLGEPTGIELGGESSGLIPDPEWKRKWWKDRWWPGDSANMSIGQGAVSVTPMQAAVMTAAIANGGKVFVPRLVDDGSGDAAPRKTSHWKPQNVALVRKGLRLVVSEGTGTAADVPGKAMSGKTGSAESGKPKTHSWFVGYGPAEHPTIVVVAFAEAAGHGGSIAAPLARKVLDQYFGLKEGKIRRSTVLD